MSEVEIRHDDDKLAAPQIVIIGGGGGTAAIYGEVAAWTPNAFAVVAMSDSGGSTGKIREELDISAPGDLRNVMVASSLSEDVRALEGQRFGGEGSLRSHSAFNILIAAYIDLFGPAEGVRMASRLMQVPGTVLPVTLDSTQLRMEDGDRVIKGEHEIDVYSPITSDPRISLEPPATLNPEAADALRNADLIVIPAGSVYTSLLAALTVDGVADILRESNVPVVMLCNLATEQHQTDGWDVTEFVRALQRHGIRIDVVLYNNEQPTEDMLANYASEGQHPVEARPERFADLPMVQFIGAALLSHETPSHNPLDPVKRGLMRHDAGKVVGALGQILRRTRATA